MPPEEDEKFQKTVLDGVAALKTQQQTLLTNYDQLSKETKAAMEELTKVKNSINDQSQVLGKLQKLQVQLRHEQRMAFGDPLKRLLADPEKRERINLGILRAVNKEGDLTARHAARFKALGEDSSPGSTLINDDLLNELYDTLATYGKWSTLGVKRLGTKTTKMPVKTARPVANFVLTEGGQLGDDTNKAGTSVSVEVEIIGVLLNVSLQLLEDSEFDVASDVMNDFVEAYSYRMDWAAFQADGTADVTDGGFTGAFEAGTAAVAAATHTSVGALTLDDFVKCLTTVDAQVLTRASKWWLHNQMLARIVGIKDGAGRPLFQTALEAPSPGAIGSILGYPTELVMAAPNTDGVSKKIALFGDPQAFVVGVRRDYTFEASDQHKWDTLQRSFRAYGRAGFKMRRALGMAVLTTAAA